MAVALDAAGTEVRGAGVTAVNLTFTVGAGSNRALICTLAFDHNVTSLTATWDNGGTNQAMAAITGANVTNALPESSDRIVMFGLVAPTSGTHTLRAAWTTTSNVYIDAISFTGVDQTGGATTFAHGTSATGSGVTPSITVTSAAGNYTVAVHESYFGTSAVNQTQLYQDGTDYGGAANYAAGAATVTLTATQSGSQPWASIGVDVVAAAVVAGQVPYNPWPQMAPLLAQ